MNVQEYLYGILAGVGETVYAYPSQWEHFPIISFYQRGGETSMNLNGAERLIRYSFQIDVWDKGETPQRMEATAQAAAAALTAAGLVRQFTADVPDKPGFFHKTMRFNGKIDQETGKVYGA
ncbi:hypothetical protein SDC9_181558 [bioreactor metagenome]|uniref:DUF3168 domain-containing protein n=1 Tax=bioreactor metagenome TaxID=1076179 RepID=A0A645H6E3_9ZZZZ